MCFSIFGKLSFPLFLRDNFGAAIETPARAVRVKKKIFILFFGFRSASSENFSPSRKRVSGFGLGTLDFALVIYPKN